MDACCQAAKEVSMYPHSRCRASTVLVPAMRLSEVSPYSLVRECPRKKQCGAQICTPGCRLLEWVHRNRSTAARASMRSGRSVDEEGPVLYGVPLFPFARTQDLSKTFSDLGLSAM